MTEAYWALIAVVVLAAAKLVNGRTKHWSEWPWYSKVVGLVVEVLDLWRPAQVRKPKQ
jgi:hypothetical protein